MQCSGLEAQKKILSFGSDSDSAHYGLLQTTHFPRLYCFNLKTKLSHNTTLTGLLMG